MKAVNIEQDEKAIEAVKTLSAYCEAHKHCTDCFLLYEESCVLDYYPEGFGIILNLILEKRQKAWEKNSRKRGNYETGRHNKD